MKAYLILFSYREFCQGWENAQTYALVYATTFENACSKLKEHFKDARDFINVTYESK